MVVLLSGSYIFVYLWYEVLVSPWIQESRKIWNCNQDEAKCQRKGTEITQGLKESFRAVGGRNYFLKTSTEGDTTRDAGNLFQYFTTHTENAPLLTLLWML